MPHDAEIPPGPNAGRVWRDAVYPRRDPLAGRTVYPLTAYRGHSHHVVGPTPCWLDQERLLVVSDREGQSNLFACHVTSHSLTQLTDLRGGARPELVQRSATKADLEFWYGDRFYQLDLASLRMRLRRSAVLKTAVAAPRARGPRPAFRVGKVLRRDGRVILWISDRAAVVSRRALLALRRADARYALTQPCLDPTAQHVVFGADTDGYAQIFAVKIDDFRTLPPLTDALAIPRAKLSATSAHRPTSPQA